jgi:hypothetical protein
MSPSQQKKIEKQNREVCAAFSRCQATHHFDEPLDPVEAMNAITKEEWEANQQHVALLQEGYVAYGDPFEEIARKEEIRNRTADE